jgi:hypothetical protein
LKCKIKEKVEDKKEYKIRRKREKKEGIEIGL